MNQKIVYEHLLNKVQCMSVNVAEKNFSASAKHLK
jgi:hypothetical protein